MSDSSIVKYTPNGGSHRTLFGAALSLITRRKPFSPPPAPANTLGGVTHQFDAFALRLDTGKLHRAGEGIYTNGVQGWASPPRFDARGDDEKRDFPWISYSTHVAFANLCDNPYGLKSELLDLASRPIIEASPKSYFGKKYDVKAGDVEDYGIGKYKAMNVTLQVTAIDKAHLIPFARQIIDNSLAQKLTGHEKNLLGYARTEKEPLALPSPADRYHPLYVFVEPIAQVANHRELESIRKSSEYFEDSNQFNNLSDAARHAYEIKHQNFALLEILLLESTPKALPAALHGQLTAARAMANLTSDERLYMEEQRITREARLQNRYAKLATHRGADESQETQKSEYIWMTIDWSQRLSGSVVAGKYKSRTLDDMTGPELMDLYSECVGDPASKTLCEIYLDYANPRGWKTARPSGSDSSGDVMTYEQACEELGVSAKATAKEIRHAYRSMLTKVHSDTKVGHPDHEVSDARLQRIVEARNTIKNNRTDLTL